jgi:hypothetical protein
MSGGMVYRGGAGWWLNPFQHVTKDGEGGNRIVRREDDRGYRQRRYHLDVSFR